MMLVEQNVRQSLAIADRGYTLETGRVSGEGSAQRFSKIPRCGEAFLGMARAK